MSKGIVKKTPSVTSKYNPGKLQVREIEGAGNQGLLNTEIDFDTSPTFAVEVGDYVEFALSLGGTNYPIRKVFSRAIITELANPQTGQRNRLMVTAANPNSVAQSHSTLTFDYYGPFPLATGDYVEISHANAVNCQVIRKIECVGTIQSISGGSSGTMQVNKVKTNIGGLSVGSSIPLTLSYIGTAPFNVSDVVEFRVVGQGAGKYVQLLNR